MSHISRTKVNLIYALNYSLTKLVFAENWGQKEGRGVEGERDEKERERERGSEKDKEKKK